MKLYTTLCVLLLTSAVGASAAVTVGGLTYSIVDVHTASSIGPDLMEQHADGEFIVIRLTVHNSGNNAATISAEDFHLRRHRI